MSDTRLGGHSFEQRHQFLLRKLHSLSGIVPIGVFLIEHLLTNSLAAGWASAKPGPQRFNEAVHGLHNLPYLWALELFGIFLPLAFHALYGIRIALTAEPNVWAYPYMDNWRYTLQRVSGYVAFVFIVIHLAKFRFAHWFGGVDFLDPANANKFEITRRGLMEWSVGGWEIPAILTLTLYVIGLAASVYHFANGIWSFCVSWGITVGEKAQRRVGLAAAAVGIVLFAWGAMSLYAFKNAESGDIRSAPPDAAAAHVAQTPANAGAE